MFHPKGSGNEHFANKWMEAIKANRADHNGGDSGSAGDCHVMVRQEEGAVSYTWSGSVVDSQNQLIKGCEVKGVVIDPGDSFEISCDALGGSITVDRPNNQDPADNEKLDFSFKEQLWQFPNASRCDAGVWMPESPPAREIKCRFQCK
jgi:hypothetical protein